MDSPLRLVICGSVDDGKSSLIGRLLYDTNPVFEDQLHAVERDAARYGTRGEAADLALPVDGLQAEREQGITIDVAYRYVETPRRRLIIADAPGHEHYTRNMATGASNADLAVVLIDARKGAVVQTARHSRIASLLGIRHVVLAVNKMDLVDWDQARFEAIAADYAALSETLGFETVQAIPICALDGDNIAAPGGASDWYDGPSLLEHLEQADAAPAEEARAFRMPVQYVNRPSAEFRGYCGRIAQGTVKPGDRVRIAPSGGEAEIAAITVWQDDPEMAEAGDSVTLSLSREIDVSRGDVIAAAEDPVEASDQFQAQLIWMGDELLVAGRSYLMKIHTRTVGLTVTRIKHRLDLNDGSQRAAATLGLNDIGCVNIATDRPVPFMPYAQSRTLGGFILIDRATNATIGAGMIDFSLRRAQNIQWQALEVDKDARAGLKMQKPMCLWLTGLSGAGKSTIANMLERRLLSEGRHTYLLDGDNVRHGLNRDLGFTEAERVENIRRVAEVAKLMVDAGLVVVVAFISPYRAEREMARTLFEDGEFIEVFVDASLAACEARDTKGLYAKARRGEIKNFTGIDSAYEVPETPELRLDTEALGIEACVDRLITEIRDRTD